ncbi:MAG: EF-P lysine aminoacylase GenX, partial [Gammaproteobacteria bacterium]|nr:EF-P lysine aminoacylase GenX [Gammaproteobacteria bacterium]
MPNWQPNASPDGLRARAKLLRAIREFFYARDILEVETPILSEYGVTDVYLENFTTQYQNKTYYLQTSPEYAMKRLLAAGSGSIYQISKAFRQGEVGRKHNPEFTLLEWYHLSFNQQDLMLEIDELLQAVINTKPAKQISYQACWQEYLALDPINANLTELQNLIQANIKISEPPNDKDTCLQLIMSHCIEPKLGFDAPVFIYHYPASQAALAKLHTDDPRIAERFELFINGIELANGFSELTDANEQNARFKQDQQQRQQLGLPRKEIDSRFIAALKHGLPECAGVALGLDRLLMLSCQQDIIKTTLS